MKMLAITTALIASMLANALTAQAAPRQPAFDAKKLFDDIADRGSG